MLLILQLLLAVVPGVLIVWFIYRADLYEKENWLPLLLCFVLGMVITFPIMKLQEWVHFQGLDKTDTVLRTLFVAFILVALTEELVKFAAIWAYPFQQRFFNEPLDGIVYAIMIGMGFATLENVLYAYRYDLGTTIVRAITAVPAHATFAALVGYYFGYARFQQAKRWPMLLKGLGLSVFIHGVYDFFILQEINDGLILLAVLTLSIGIFIALRLIRQLQMESPFRKEKNDVYNPADDNPFS